MSLKRIPVAIVGAGTLAAWLFTFVGGPALGQGGPTAEPGPVGPRKALPTADADALIAAGRALYVRSCASCHGPDGRGTESFPSLVGVGAAAADFQLRTGRMPMSDGDVQAVRKPSAFGPEQIDALVAFVAELDGGPDIPSVELENRDLSNGQQLFVANCVPCHGGTGNGGAAGERALAPSLRRSEPLDVAEAIITGPGEMPHFELSPEDRDDVVAYVRFLMTQPAPGGASVGGVGPVPEGFIGWGLGVLVLTAICYVLGAKGAGRPRRGGPGSDEVAP